MRIAICDDERIFIEEVKTQLDKWLSVSKKSSQILLFENGRDLITEMKYKPIDIIFLDIVMPVLNGIDAAREIRKFDNKAQIVFLTFSEEYAIDSYSVDASGYLLKPLKYEELSRVLDKTTQNIEKAQNSLVINANDGFRKLYLNEIEFVEAAYKGTMISLISGVKLNSTSPLYYFEEQLTIRYGFYKCHRSYIVNLLHISTFAQSEVITKTGYKIPIARMARKDFKEAYISFYF